MCAYAWRQLSMSKRQTGFSEFCSHSKRPSRDSADEEVALSPGQDKNNEEDAIEDPSSCDNLLLSTGQRYVLNNGYKIEH